MLEGFTCDLTARQLLRHFDEIGAGYLDERILFHERRAADYEAKARRVETACRTGTDAEAALVFWPAYGDDLRRHARRHRQRSLALARLRDQLSMHEIYRLGERDLQALEWRG